MENLIQSATIITAALLRDHPNPSTEKIAQLMTQSLEAIEIAIGRQNARNTQKHAELKKSYVIKR